MFGSTRLPSIKYLLAGQMHVKQELCTLNCEGRRFEVGSEENDLNQPEPLDYSNLLDFPTPDSLCDTLSPASEVCFEEEEEEEDEDHEEDSRESNQKPIEGQSNRMNSTRIRSWKKYSKKKNLTLDEIEKKRNLANKQERRRMHRLNNALERLRQTIPANFQFVHPPRRLSKIKTLRLAISYILHLEQTLGIQRGDSVIRFNHH